MAEKLVSRVKRLVSGGVTSIVDAIESASPEMVMGEALREVDAAIGQVRDELGKVVASKHVASTRLAAAGEKHAALVAQIELAVREDRDDLAEAAIARQLDLEAQIPVLESAIEDASAEEAELERYLAALTARRREMEEELAAMRANRSPTEAGEAQGPSAADAAERRVDRAENAFNRAMRATGGTPGVAGVDRDAAAKLAELEKLARDSRIRERLAAVKAARGEST